MAKVKKVAKVGVKKQSGYLYFVDKDGDIAMVAMNRGGKKKATKKKSAAKKKKPAKKKAATKKKTTKKKTTKKRR